MKLASVSGVQVPLISARERTVYEPAVAKVIGVPVVGAALAFRRTLKRISLPVVVVWWTSTAIVLAPVTSRAGFSRMKLKLLSARLSSTPFPEEPDPVAMVVNPTGVGGYGMPER